MQVLYKYVSILFSEDTIKMATWHSICVVLVREYFKKIIDMQLISSKSLIRVLGMVLVFTGMLSQKANAQGYFERYSNFSGSSLSITGGVGPTVLFADLADPDYSKLLNGMQFNVGVSYRLTNYISIRGEGTGYRLYLERPTNLGATGNHPNLSVVGASGQILLVHDIFSRTSIDRGQKSWNIYVLGGIGNNYFIPKDADTGENLREILPHGVYAKITPIFPIGSGIEFFPTSYIGVGLEWQYVTTNTDLLDDAKPQVESNTSNDSYFVFGAKISYQIGGANNGGSVSGFNYQSYLKKSKKRAKYK